MKNAYLTNDSLLTYQEAAACLKIAPKTLMNWKSAGRFKKGHDYVEIGSSVRFKSEAILRIQRNGF